VVVVVVVVVSRAVVAVRECSRLPVIILKVKDAP